jgi:pyruvate/2-oxoglutarate/acetoin dehydrogenase E1 component
VPDGEIVDRLGTAKVLREGGDATIVALAAMVPRALAAAEELAGLGIESTVVDVRSLVPLDTQTILREVSKTGRLFTVEENPRLCGGAPRWFPSRWKRFFRTSTVPRCASRHRTCHCRQPLSRRTLRFRQSHASSRRSGR